MKWNDVLDEVSIGKHRSTLDHYKEYASWARNCIYKITYDGTDESIEKDLYKVLPKGVFPQIDITVEQPENSFVYGDTIKPTYTIEGEFAMTIRDILALQLKYDDIIIKNLGDSDRIPEEIPFSKMVYESRSDFTNIFASVDGPTGVYLNNPDDWNENKDLWQNFLYDNKLINAIRQMEYNIVITTNREALPSKMTHKFKDKIIKLEILIESINDLIRRKATIEEIVELRSLIDVVMDGSRTFVSNYKLDISDFTKEYIYERLMSIILEQESLGNGSSVELDNLTKIDCIERFLYDEHSTEYEYVENQSKK